MGFMKHVDIALHNYFDGEMPSLEQVDHALEHEVDESDRKYVEYIRSMVMKNLRRQQEKNNGSTSNSYKDETDGQFNEVDDMENDKMESVHEQERCKDNNTVSEPMIEGDDAICANENVKENNQTLISKEAFYKAVNLAKANLYCNDNKINNTEHLDILNRNKDDLFKEFNERILQSNLPSFPTFFCDPDMKRPYLIPVLSLFNELLYYSIIYMSFFNDGCFTYSNLSKNHARMHVDFTYEVEDNCKAYNKTAKMYIKNLYKSIDHKILKKRLKQNWNNAKLIDMLMHCLKTYSPIKGKGIPIGYEPSTILALEYMSSIQEELLANDIVHSNYKGELYLFANSDYELKRNYKKCKKIIKKHGLSFRKKSVELFDSGCKLNDRDDWYDKVLGYRTIKRPYWKVKSIANINIDEFLQHDFSTIRLCFNDDFDDVIDFDKFIVNLVGYLYKNPYKHIYFKYWLLGWMIRTKYQNMNLICWIRSLLKDQENPPYIHWKARTLLKKWGQTIEFIA